MKSYLKSLLFFSGLLMSGFSFAQVKQIFENPNIIEIIATHKSIAILPFKTTISNVKQVKSYDLQADKEHEEFLGIDLLSGFYTVLLSKQSKYTVAIQDVYETVTLLRKNNLFDNCYETPPEVLAKALGVDAVIKCSYSYEIVRSELGALVTKVLFGTGNIATGRLTMEIFDKFEGDLVWRFHKQFAEDIYSSPTDMIEVMMKKVGRNFPYNQNFKKMDVNNFDYRRN